MTVVQPPVIQLDKYLSHGQITSIAKHFGVTRLTVYRAIENPPRTDGKDAGGRPMKKKSKKREIYAYCCNMVRENLRQMAEDVAKLPHSV